MVYALLCFAVVCYRSNSLKWRHSERDGVSNHQHHDCLSNGLFRRKSKKTSAALVFVWGIHRWPVNSPHKGPVTRKMFPYDDVIMLWIRMTSQTLWQSSYQKMVVNVATNYNTESRFSSVIIENRHWIYHRLLSCKFWSLIIIGNKYWRCGHILCLCSWTIDTYYDELSC